MRPTHTGWRPPPPPPPVDTNGWGRYVAATLEHIMVRLYYIEKHHDLCSNLRVSDAPISKPSKETTWAERRDLARDVASIAKDVRTGLMWIAVIVLLGGLIAKKIDLSQLQTLRSWLAMPG